VATQAATPPASAAQDRGYVVRHALAQLLFWSAFYYLLPAVLRQVLVALVIPPLVFKPDGRGLHDLAAGTICVTLQTARGE